MVIIFFQMRPADVIAANILTIVPFIIVPSIVFLGILFFKKVRERKLIEKAA